VYRHRGQGCHATFYGGHIHVRNLGVGFGCILHTIRSVVVGCRGQKYSGVVVVWGGHLSFGHVHQVD